MPVSAFAAARQPVSTKITLPPTAKARDPLPSSQASISLEELSYSNLKNDTSRYNASITPAGAQTPYEAGTRPPSGLQTPTTANDLESNTPPEGAQAAHIVPSWSSPRMNKWRVLAAASIYFGNGLSDSAPGALIPYMEHDYNIGYAIVSLIFVTNAVGFILAAFFTTPALHRLGRAKSCMAAEALIITGYIIIVCTPPFPAVVFAFFLLGLGMAFTLALNNVFCANLANATVIVGAVQGVYGIGGIVGPIIATSVVSEGLIWSRFYLIGIAVRVFCFVFAGWAFKDYEKEPTSILSSSLNKVASQRRATEQTEQKQAHPLKRALANRVTIFGALFIFAYQGAEVSISGWVISYLINVRGGDPTKVGYVTSGFWGGITLGRFTLSQLGRKIGEKRFVYILGAGAIAFQLLVWFVPNVVGEAVAVAILGLLLGPIYPASSYIFTTLLPMDIQMTAYSFIASAGSSGGAIAPLMTGLLAQAVGTFVLHPICIALFVVMIGCGVGLPKMPAKRAD